MGRKNSLTEIFLHKKIFIRRETIATQKAQHCKPVASLNKSLFTEENGTTQKHSSESESGQMLSCVKWGSVMSYFYELKTGLRQGGVLSPFLFSIFIDDLVNI